MSKENYVSYAVAILLKSKGFDERCYKKYNLCGDLFDSTEFTYGPKAPTLQMAIDWLREIHHLWIDIDPLTNDKRAWSIWFNNNPDLKTVNCYMAT